MVPMRFEAAVTATSRVLSVTTAATASGSSSPVRGSNSAQRTVAPTCSATSSHGRMLASWSSRLTTTSSPGTHPLARVRAISKVSAVMLRPTTTPRGSEPMRSPRADRASRTASSELRSAAVTPPRTDIGRVSWPATASATACGTCDPPGPSKCAAPPRSAGNWPRSASMSKAGGVRVVTGSDGRSGEGGMPGTVPPPPTVLPRGEAGAQRPDDRGVRHSVVICRKCTQARASARYPLANPRRPHAPHLASRRPDHRSSRRPRPRGRRRAGCRCRRHSASRSSPLLSPRRASTRRRSSPRGSRAGARTAGWAATPAARSSTSPRARRSGRAAPPSGGSRRPTRSSSRPTSP